MKYAISGRVISMKDGTKRPLVALVKGVRSRLKHEKHEQAPQLEGSQEITGRGFLGG